MNNEDYETIMVLVMIVFFLVLMAISGWIPFFVT